MITMSMISSRLDFLLDTNNSVNYGPIIISMLANISSANQVPSSCKNGCGNHSNRHIALMSTYNKASAEMVTKKAFFNGSIIKLFM